MICQICKTEIDEKFIIKLKKCNHIFCFKCICSYINIHFDVVIQCPFSNCCKTISDGDLRKFFSNDQIKEYEKISVSMASSQIRKCLSKNCHFYFYPDDINIIFECAYCSLPNCLKCNKRHVNCQSPQDEKLMDEIAKKNIAKRKRQEFDNFDKTLDLIPNPDSFECGICCDFIIPREGYILRNCLHKFCSSCLKNTFENYKFLNQTSCPTCKRSLDPRESAKLITLQKLVFFAIKEKRHKYFNCKSVDCDNFWKVEKNSGFYTCDKCEIVNCHSCCAVHPKMSCANYLQTCGSEDKSFLEKEEKVSCFHCGKLLVKDGGCGSLSCNNCNNATCLFTGEEVGETTGCKCVSTKPCHKDCKHGCIR